LNLFEPGEPSRHLAAVCNETGVVSCAAAASPGIRECLRSEAAGSGEGQRTGDGLEGV
jgi:hypothetical protein